ncbi:type II toxin-antitoxin system death-on-curing family toxin [Streptomyces sp. NPDC006482]|uniref:type II toxin-antitoxin system death-on-curing family toxin n=1 Tax=unclassified Streptomyces TaxID=2593676 RepID=UPI0022508CB8|nr:type II toxin-antitoxin system death-on-curing family toxin [Streptomyces sp. NBC_00094]MCX5390978.1 type II toxin-antitoxin system death-on-curing family toxin [Streptomyces sp. NBC_00094]
MKYLTVQEVLELAEFACAGQQIAVRDLGLLSSAVHRPQSQMFGVEAYSDLFEKAAALLQSLAVNHPLVDGNKRMAWMCAVVFLDFNGTEMVGVDQDEAYKLVIDVATGDLEDIALIARRLRGLHEAA